MLYVVAILGGFWCAGLLRFGLALLRFILEERRYRQPLVVREAQEVAAQAWRGS